MAESDSLLTQIGPSSLRSPAKEIFAESLVRCTFCRLAPWPFVAGYSPGLRCAVESALNAWHQLSTLTHALKCRAVDRRCPPPVVTIYEKVRLALSLEGADHFSISRRSPHRTNRVRTCSRLV